MCIAFYSHDHDSQRFFPRWCDLNPTGTGFCVSAYRSIQLFRRESALISVRAPSSSYPVVCFSLGTWIVSVARNFQTWSNGDKKMRVWVILGIVLIPRNVLLFSFSVFACTTTTVKTPTVCVLSTADCVHDIQHDFGAVQGHHLFDQWCHVLRVVDVRLRERRGCQQHCVSIGLVHDVWLLCGKAIPFECCFHTVSMLCQHCFNTVLNTFCLCFVGHNVFDFLTFVLHFLSL